MNQKSLKKYKIDHRTAEDIEQLIRKGAASYTPEWHFDTEDPDIGSTIGRIFARQMQENIRAVNHVLDVYQTEFVNLLDLTLERAVPAGTVVVFHLADSGVDGTEIPRGTHLIAEQAGGSEEPAPVFETDRSLYVTASQISDVFLTDREEGEIVPLAGHFDKPRYYVEEGRRGADLAEEGETGETSEQEAEAEFIEEEDVSLHPFILFGERGGIARNAILLKHPFVFDVENDAIYIRFDGGEKLIEKIAAGKCVFSWLGKSGLRPFDSVTIAEDGQTVRLVKHDECRKTGEEEEPGQMSLVVLEALGPQREATLIEDIHLSSSGSAKPADYVGDGNGEWDPAEFQPFTDTLSLYTECYIGKNEYFDKPGSEVTIDFHLTFEEHLIGVSKETREAELKVFKKKERAVREEVVTDSFVDEIAIEYFNGIGWRRLICDLEYRTLMAGENPGQYTMKFISPADWAPTEIGAFHGRVLRMRLISSDNCYMRPANHHFPIITGLKISYSYRRHEVRPAHIECVNGTKIFDLTGKSRSKEPFAVFSPLEYADDALYLGFDRKIENGPVGILFRIGNSSGQSGLKCRYEYSTRRGFKQMRVIDGTAAFSRSGIVQFIPPADFAPMKLEGKRRYWLRIVREEAEWEKEQKRTLPHIEQISINAMTVTNAVTGEEQDFYIDEVGPGMHFFLGAGNILDAQVWVNERDSLSGEEMRTLAAEHPDEVRVDYDLIGNITACFVLWREVEQLPDGLERQNPDAREWLDRRCYRIDRLTGEIYFGDGIHVDIPRVTDDAAFRVTLRTCAGEAGNVEEGTVTSTEQDFMFIDSITNPVRAYGGSNMESVRQALLRGADRIHSRGRMVSMGDYCRAILRYSGVIDKVRGITGITIDGRENPAELSFVLLMKDFAEGSFSFHKIEAELKEYLLSACEITVAPHRLHIVEPVFVAVSVSVWTEVMKVDDSFEVQNTIRDTLGRYLNPVNGGTEEDAEGWEIGMMPKRAQILMQLATLKNQALIRKTSITAKYTDNEGEHEIDYDDLVVSPFMVCMSGEHHVHILYNREKE